MSHWKFLEATLGKDVTRHVIQRFNLPNRNRARKLFRKCLIQIGSFHEDNAAAMRPHNRGFVKCQHGRHTIAQLLAGLCLSNKINYANHDQYIKDEEAMMQACQLDMHRRRSKFDAAIRPHDIKGICRYDIWREWESQNYLPISAEWIRELVANRHVQFKFRDLSPFNQLKASAGKNWVIPRLYEDPILDCSHGCSRY